MSQTKQSNLIKQIKLTPQEIEVIVACLLGDGALSKSGKNYRLRIEHNSKHKEYVEWKYYLLKRLCISKVQNVTAHSSLRFGTVGHPEITKLRHLWYQQTKQVVPGLKLTPIMIAVWFMDDGTKHRDTVDISVHNFRLEALKSCSDSFGISELKQQSIQTPKVLGFMFLRKVILTSKSLFRHI